MRFTPDFATSKRMKMRRSGEGLAFYIQNELGGQSI